MKLSEADSYLDTIMTMLGMERQAVGKVDVTKRTPRTDVEIEAAEWEGPKGKGWGAVFCVTDDAGRKWRKVRIGSGTANPLGPEGWGEGGVGENAAGVVV